MANRQIIKQFESFSGLDLQPTILTKDSNSANDILNCQFYKTRSVRKRPGCQIIGQTGNFLALHTYVYVDDNGSTKQELVAINDNLWRLKSDVITITRGSSASWALQLYQESSTSTYRAKILESGSAITLSGGNSYYDLGVGTELAPVTVYDLASTVDALANYSCTLPSKSAKVNGNQSSVRTITVEAGHGISAGDYVTLYDYVSERLVYRFITSTTGTTITFHASWPAVTVKDDQILGRGASVAAGIPVRGATEVVETIKSILYYYWEPVIAGNAPRPYNYTYGSFPFSSFYSVPSGNIFYHPTFKNANNCCYITLPISGTFSSEKNTLYKYDGQSIYRAGSGKISYTLLSTSGAAGVSAGTYKYAAVPQTLDAKGNICDNNWAYQGSAGSLDFQITFVGPKNVTFQVTSEASGDSGLSYNVKHGYNDLGSGAAITTINCYYSAAKADFHTFEVGDKVYFFDNSGTLVSRTVTGVSKVVGTSTITIDTASTVLAGTHFTCAQLLDVYRTGPSGFTYYFLKRIIADQAGVFTLVDADDNPYANLTLVFPEKSKLSPTVVNGVEHNPPSCTIMEFHQGAIVVAGDPASPETISWSEIGELEFFPQPENLDDIPSNLRGPIAALASEDETALAVFKPNAYYRVVGDLSTGAYNIGTIKEGDYGISSHRSIARVDGVLLGLGSLGIAGIAGGNYISEGAISPALWNESGNAYSISVCDYVNQKYKIFIPTQTSAVSMNVAVYDIIRKQWWNWNYPSKVEPSGGWSIYRNDAVGSDEVYHLSLTDAGVGSDLFGFVYRELGKRSEPVSYIYWDNAQAISQRYRLAWLHMGSPELRKAWVMAQLYQFIDELEVSMQPYPFTIQVDLYRDFNSSHLVATKNLTFNSRYEFEKVLKLFNQFGRSIQLVLTNSTGGESMHLSGLQILADIDYDSDSLK